VLRRAAGDAPGAATPRLTASSARAHALLTNDENPAERGSLERMTRFELATSTLAR
jgi:hypothetical protein